MQNIPWWAKILAKIVLSRFPFRYEIWQGLRIFRCGQMDDSDYAISVFNNHAGKAGVIKSLYGKTILELGPGDSVATAIIAASYGARAILVDVGKFARRDVLMYKKLVKKITDLGLSPPNLSECRNLDMILDICGARYMTNGLASLAQIKDGSIDFIFSNAVLEHVRKSELLETMKECRRILSQNGICSHYIDLRDHLDNALNNLRFSEWLWESKLFVKSGFYTNRIRYRDMLKIFSNAGFSYEVIELTRWPGMPTPRHKLASAFRNLPVEELCVSEFSVLLW